MGAIFMKVLEQTEDYSEYNILYALLGVLGMGLGDLREDPGA